MNQQKFFEKVLQELEKLNIPYMITGSVGSFLYGEPRMTNDMDLVIELDRNHALLLSKSFETDDYYFPPFETVEEAIQSFGQFNIIHIESGSKVDMIIRKDTEFAKTEFSRKKQLPFSSSLNFQSASAEDIIISKLQYFQMSRSEKHANDIRGILLVSGESLDQEYITKWVKKLGLLEIWSGIN